MIGLAERYNLYSQTSVMVTHILTGPTSVSLLDHLYRSRQDPLFLSFFNHNQSNGSRECLSSPQPRVFIISYVRLVFKFRLPPFWKRLSIGESHQFLPKYHLYQITDWRFSISITSWAKVMLIPIWHIYRILGGITRLYTGNMIQETVVRKLTKLFCGLPNATACKLKWTNILTTASSGLHVQGLKIHASYCNQYSIINEYVYKG